MDIVKCLHCRTRVVLCEDGSCPSCRRKPRGSPVMTPENRSAEEPHPNPPPSALPPTRRSPGCLERAITQIDEMLRLGKLPRNCSVCGVPAESVCEVQVQHEDVTLLLPVRICRRCAINASLVERETVVQAGILSLALLMFVVFLATPHVPLALLCLVVATVTFLSMQLPRLAARRRTAPLPEVLSRVTAYRGLLAATPDVVLAYSPASYRVAAESLAMPRRFAESVQFHRSTAYLGSEAELMRSQMPPPIGHAMVEIVDRAIVRFFRETLPGCGYFVQVVCAVLPGNRNAFEVQGLPVELTARLLGHLSALPSWPVVYPFVFVVQRRLRGVQSGAPSRIEQPLVTWWRLIAPGEELSFAEIACRYHHIESQAEPVAFTVRDIEVLRAQLPDSAELAVISRGVTVSNGSPW